jgi:hypothetical protein
MYGIIYDVAIIKLNYSWLYIYFEHNYLWNKCSIKYGNEKLILWLSFKCSDDRMKIMIVFLLVEKYWVNNLVLKEYKEDSVKISAKYIYKKIW